MIQLKSQDRREAEEWAEMYARSLEKNVPGLAVSAAMPAAVERADGWYRYQIVLTGQSVAAMVAAWRKLLAVRSPPNSLKVGIDIDAHNFV